MAVTAIIAKRAPMLVITSMAARTARRSILEFHRLVTALTVCLGMPPNQLETGLVVIEMSR